MVHEDGRVEHVGEHLDDRIATFPNFDFIRRLKDELSNDQGTIFRYAAHENTYVNAIYRQLMESGENVADRDELLEFIRTISKISKPNLERGYEPWEGDRNMVDLKDMVVQYYYHPATSGSNSIKAVLPAILKSSSYLRKDIHSR